MKIISAHRSSQSYKTYPYHNHSVWEFIIGLTGSGTAWINSEPYDFDEGTVFCIPPGIPHKKTSEKGFTDGNIFVTDFTPPNGAQLIVLHDDALGSFRHIFNMAHNLCMMDVPNAKGLMDALTEMLYQLFLSRYNPEFMTHKTAEKFQNILLQNFQDVEFDLAKAEDGTGYCRSYFRKVFKSSTGISPSAYLQRLRIDFAKRQLRQFRQTISIREVAELSGFSDPDYFSRVFKNTEGISPREYIASLGDLSIDEFILSGDQNPESVYWRGKRQD